MLDINLNKNKQIMKQSNLIKFNKDISFRPQITVVKLVATTKSGDCQYQLKQSIKSMYASGGETTSIMEEGEIDLFAGVEREKTEYVSERYCLKTFPKQYDTVAKAQAVLDSMKEDAYIGEIYGLNPFGLQDSYEKAIELGYTTLDKVMSNTLKMKGAGDSLQQMFVNFKGKSCPVYSIKKLMSAKANNGKIDFDCSEASVVGRGPMMLDSDEDEDIFSDQINEAVEAEGEW
jgi:hypothetical protein